MEAGGIAMEKKAMQIFESRRRHCNTPTCLYVMGWTCLSGPRRVRSDPCLGHCHLPPIPPWLSQHTQPPALPQAHQHLLILTCGIYPQSFPQTVYPSHPLKIPPGPTYTKAIPLHRNSPFPQGAKSPLPFLRAFPSSTKTAAACTVPPISLIRYLR